MKTQEKPPIQKKSVWRAIGGFFMMGFGIFSMSRLPTLHEPPERAFWYVIWTLLIFTAGRRLASVYYFQKAQSVTAVTPAARS